MSQTDDDDKLTGDSIINPLKSHDATFSHIKTVFKRIEDVMSVTRTR